MHHRNPASRVRSHFAASRGRKSWLNAEVLEIAFLALGRGADDLLLPHVAHAHATRPLIDAEHGALLLMVGGEERIVTGLLLARPVAGREAQGDARIVFLQPILAGPDLARDAIDPVD